MKKSILLLMGAALLVATSCRKTDPLAQPHQSAPTAISKPAALPPQWIPIVTSANQFYNRLTAQTELTVTFDYDPTYMIPTGMNQVWFAPVNSSDVIIGSWMGPYSTTSNPTGNSFTATYNFMYAIGQRFVLFTGYTATPPTPTSSPIVVSPYGYMNFGTIL
jgi:hypothetical protein